LLQQKRGAQQRISEGKENTKGSFSPEHLSLGCSSRKIVHLLFRVLCAFHLQYKTQTPLDINKNYIFA
jgi:hypothetical protein